MTGTITAFDLSDGLGNLLTTVKDTSPDAAALSKIFQTDTLLDFDMANLGRSDFHLYLSPL
jgi:hypothetical protein